MATVDLPELSVNDRRHRIRKYLHYVFTGWGQTKIVEDNFNRCRYVETQGVLNKTRCCATYYTAMANMGTISLHERTEVTATSDTPLAKGRPGEVFHCNNHTPSLPDANNITGKATWATHSPQSSKVLQAGLWLFEHCHESNYWALADKCDQCEFFQRRSIIQKRGDPNHYIVLGALDNKILLVWKVLTISLPKLNHRVFLIGSRAVDNTSPIGMVVLDIDQFTVFPSSPISTAHYFLAMKRSLADRMGVVVLQHSKGIPVLQYAAQQAFFQIGLPRLKRLCTEYDIETPAITLAPTVSACVKFFIEKYTKKAPSDADVLQILSLRCAEENTLVGEICDEDMLLEVLSPDGQKVLKANREC